MAHHDWGDENFDWNGLNAALRHIHDFCLRWGRLGTHVKEKYGAARVSAWFWHGDLHGMLYPGYVYCQYKDRFLGLGNKLWWCDVYVFPKIARWTGLHWLVSRWQMKVYGWAYEGAVRRWPHLKDEILQDADHPNLIRGGQEVHDRYWTKVGDNE